MTSEQGRREYMSRDEVARGAYTERGERSCSIVETVPGGASWEDRRTGRKAGGGFGEVAS